MRFTSPALALLAVTWHTMPALPAGSLHPTGLHRPDSSEVVAVTRAFHEALASGDTATVLGLLAPDAVILESGDTESRAEYAAHHLAADIAFVQAVPGAREVTSVRVEGNVGWVTATSTTRGEFRGRAIASQGAELMILSRSGDHWRIRAIHWSSHRL